jgi:hypothetical protein
VFFGDPGQQETFETLFDAAVKLARLKVSVLRATAENEAAGTHKAELGYIDRTRGFALFIPSVRGALEEDA